MLFNKRGEFIIFFYLLYLKYDYYIYIHRLFPDSKRWQLEGRKRYRLDVKI